MSDKYLYFKHNIDFQQKNHILCHTYLKTIMYVCACSNIYITPAGSKQMEYNMDGVKRRIIIIICTYIDDTTIIQI